MLGLGAVVLWSCHRSSYTLLNNIDKEGILLSWEGVRTIVLCPDGRALEQWNKSLEKLAIWMEQTKVPASIHEAIIEGLKRHATTMEEWLVMIQDPLNDLQRR